MELIEPSKIRLKAGYCLVKPIEDTTYFNAEHRKYDRKSVGKIINIAYGAKPLDNEMLPNKGNTIYFNDHDSVDVGEYLIIPVDDILGYKEED